MPEKSVLIPESLRELFIDAIALTADCYLRHQMEAMNIATDEVLVRTPSGQLAETRPVRYRVERYFASIDWSERLEIIKILSLIEQAIERLRFHPSCQFARTIEALYSYDLGFEHGKIVRLLKNKAS
ncbi:MAG: hypothetical protein AB8G05_11495 [Oligoflexales bacterium]